MNQAVFIIQGIPVRGTDLAIAAAVCAALLLLALVFLTRTIARATRDRERDAFAAAEREREMDDKMAELARASAELAGRMQTVAEVFGSRQADLTRHVGERLDAVGHRLGAGLEQSSIRQNETLTKLHERLAVIDSAQGRLATMTEEVIGLKDILSNKQARGAFGQGRMEAIVRDGLPASAYSFQETLQPSRVRPDCVVRLPGDERVLAIDAKFPLEGFTTLRDAKGEDERNRAITRVRADVGRHVKDIADKYLIAGVTQDMAVLFVPSESIYADLCEHFDDVVQKAHRARVIIVSPSLLMMAIQVMQAIVRDASVREQAGAIQNEVRLLVADVIRLQERVTKLDTHFRQVGEDVTAITTSSEKISKRGNRIDQMDFSEPAPRTLAPAPAQRNAAE